MAEQSPDLFNMDCPSRDLLELIGSKWSMLLLCSLKNGPVRTGDLRRAIAGISQKMLTQTLRDLERNGIIARIYHREIPPRVEYKLTPVGWSLSSLVKQMEAWVIEHYQYMLSAQSQYVHPSPHTDPRRML